MSDNIIVDTATRILADLCEHREVFRRAGERDVPRPSL